VRGGELGGAGEDLLELMDSLEDDDATQRVQSTEIGRAEFESVTVLQYWRWERRRCAMVGSLLWWDRWHGERACIRAVL